MKRPTYLIRNINLFLILVLLSFSNYGWAQKTLRVFIIGNSFSGNATAYLPDIAKEKGKELIIGRAELGGCSLQRHWEYVEAAEANPKDSLGKPYKGKSLRMLLSEGTWDIVTIQQFSLHSSDSGTYTPYAEKLYAYVKSIQPSAEIVLHQTWAYREDAKKFGQVAPGQFAKSSEEMWQKSRAAYHAVASKLHVRIIPVGDAFRLATTHPKYGYHADTTFDFKSPVYPGLPRQDYSLNAGYSWNKSKELAFDANHANAAGKYLGAIIWYAFLFKESPKSIQFIPEGLSKDFAAHLKNVAEASISNTR